MNYLKKEGRYKLFFIVCGIATIFRIIIAMGIPLRAIGDSPVDDVLLIEYAKSLAEGKWLGAYGPYTNVKGMTYSLFVALFYKLNIPYSMGIISLYIIACALTVKALSPKIKSIYVKGLLYILLMYSPVMFTMNYVQRIYRMAIVPTFVLLVFACHIGMYLRIGEDIKVVCKWAIADSIVLALFWYVREDSIWVLPFYIVSTFVMIYTVGKEERKIKIKKIGLVCLPYLAVVGISVMIIGLNYYHYGIASLTDLRKYVPTEYNDFIVNLETIKPDKDIETVVLTRDAIDKACDASETLNTIYEEIVLFYDENWLSYGYRKAEGEIDSGYEWWAFKQILANAGYYKDAKETSIFLEKVNNELEDAFESGVLEKKMITGSNSDGLITNIITDFELIVEKMFESGSQMLTYSTCGLEQVYGTGNLDNVRLMEIMTNKRIIYAESTEISGWILTRNNDDKLDMAIVDKNGMNLLEITFLDSLDVYKVFGTESSRIARFNTGNILANYDADDLNARIYLNGNLYKEINLGEISSDYNDEKIIYNIEQISGMDIMSDEGEEYISLGNIIVNVYQNTSWLIIALAVFSYIYMCVQSILEIQNISNAWKADWLISTAYLLSGLVILFIVCYSYRIAWNTNGRDLYLAGVIPLFDLFKYYTILRVGSHIYEKVKGRTNETYNSNTMLQ